MDFALTAEQEALVRTLRVFARRELASRSPEWDKSGEFPWDAWKQMAQLGLFGLRTPAAYGGQEADLLTTGLAVEEIGRGDFSCTYGLQLAALAGEILGRNATEEVRRQWLPAMVTGDAVLAIALTEPSVGSDAANLACRAVRQGDDYIITGEKSGISLGIVAHAVMLFATTNPAAKAHGVTAFLVPLDLPGISRSALHDLGSRAIGRAVLSFDQVRIPVGYRMGSEGGGFYEVMRGFDFNRVLIALACIGTAQACLDETMQYVKERKAFGRPIVQFEGVSFPIAEAATHLEAARLLAYRALWLADRGERHTRESAMVKWWVPKLAVDIIHQCLLLHGHYGYTDELPFGQRMRDVIGLEIGDGTAEVMKLIVARELMGRESLPY
jgi:cyclohexanecarboxyl-CoA dehydrogenase